ncbi:MAG: flagellar basal body L-ring protein FlgH [Hyphomonadaceae bacterium]|nr:flagellar basal body L-ring protein FlgH [Hyphomonadaceae bacterium]
MKHAFTTGAGLAALMLGGCAGLNDAIAPPQLTPISNPATLAGSQRVSMPLPTPVVEAQAPNSLWRAGANSFFNDQRANKIGDILTVSIEIADSAQLNNSTARSRTSTTETGIQALLGIEESIQRALPGTPSLDPAVGFDSNSASNGAGSVNRQENVKLTIAAVITDRLANGNLVIGGSQEVRINNELRELLVSGVIRPEDVAADNTIAHTKIAEARISYGGRGDISAVQRDKYGKLIYDQITPF